MIRRSNIKDDASGATVVEFALAVPVLVSMIYGIFTIGTVFMANAGLQHALGEAARYATLFPTPTDTQIADRITSRKFGLGLGDLDDPDIQTDTVNHTKTITLTYEVTPNFLFFEGPPITLEKSKTVHVAY